MAYSPDGRNIVSGSTDNSVRIWDAQAQIELNVICGHDSLVTSVAYSPDGQRIATGADDKTVRVWDAQSGTELAVFYGHDKGLTSVAFSPDGRWLASGSEDKTVRVWDVQTGIQTRVVETGQRIAEVEWTSNGCRFAIETLHSTLENQGFMGAYDYFSPPEFWYERITYDLDTRREVDRRNSLAGDLQSTNRMYSRSNDFHAYMDNDETIVKSIINDRIVARFPESLKSLDIHPTGRTWIGATGSHLFMLRLECADQEE